MRGSVFFETLRQTWKQSLAWGVGLGALGCVVVLMLPALDATAMRGMLENLPPIILQAVGFGDDMDFALSPEGLLALGFFGKLAVIFVVYPVVMGMRVTVNEEDDGILDVVLSLPVARGQMVLEKVAAYLVNLVALTGIILLGLWIGAGAVNITLNMERLVISSLNLLPMLIFVLAFATFVGSLIGRRTLALTVITAFVLGSYMLDNIGGLAKGSAAENIRLLSFFNYYNASYVMQYGLAWNNVLILLALSIVLIGSGLWFFQRRDVGV